LERWGFRVFVTYTALRTAGWITGLTETSPAARNLMYSLDYGVLVLPALLVALELIDRPWERRGKVAYLTSAVSMYTVLLFAIRQENHYLVIAMSAASAAFHAVEYMAIVTYYAWRRRESGSEAGPFRRMTRQWLRILAVYMITFGVISQYADRNMKELYMGLNLWAAFLHYAYDGMIWKLRRPNTAQALNVQLKAGEAPTAEALPGRLRSPVSTTT
jgi:amino acid transporter